jgi:hypothetical protein
MLERISPNSSNPTGIHRQLPTSFRTTKVQGQTEREVAITDHRQNEEEALIERGLTVKAKSGQPPPRWRGGTPCQSSPDAAEEHRIEQPVGREKRSLIGEDAWCPSPPPPDLLQPETNGNEGENHEHPDPARRIWIPPSGITPRHGKKPARSTTKA